MAAAAAGAPPAPSGLLPRLQHAAAALTSGGGGGGESSSGGKARPWDSWGLPGRGGQQGKGGTAGKLSGALLPTTAASWALRQYTCTKPPATRTSPPHLPHHALLRAYALQPPRPPPGVLWEVSADLASLGVSLVGPVREMAYLRAGGVRGQLAGTAAHLVLDLELRTLQVRRVRLFVSKHYFAHYFACGVLDV